MIARAMLPAALAVCCLTAGCENSLLDRSLVFFTNTTLGVEVSVSPSDATAPVKLIIGYKRAEGVLNPVYHSQGVEAPVTTDESEALTGGSLYSDKEASKSGSSSYSKKWSKSVPIPGGPKTIRRYRTEAYSVIAKIAGEVQGKAGGSADGKLSVAQWFATGEAAKILANQPGIAGAVTGSAEVAKEAAKQANAFGRLKREPRQTAYAILSLTYGMLSVLKDTDPDPKIRADAKKIVDLLDNAEYLKSIQGLKFSSFTHYSYDSATKTLTFDSPSTALPGFDRAILYRSLLAESVKGLSDALGEPNLVIKNQAGNDITATKQPKLPDEHVQQAKMLEEFDESLFSDPAVVKAVEFLLGG